LKTHTMDYKKTVLEELKKQPVWAILLVIAIFLLYERDEATRENMRNQTIELEKNFINCTQENRQLYQVIEALKEKPKS